MELIDKSALVAEIERRKTNIKNYCLREGHDARFDVVPEQLSYILSFIDTLEVKEVDLEKELSLEDYMSFFKKYPNLSDDWGFEEAWIFAEYFFELGRTVSNKAQKGKEV